MEYQDIFVDDGVVEIAIKNKRNTVIARLVFNPGDTGIAKRYGEVIKALNEISLPTDSNISNEEAIEKIVEIDNAIAAQFNTLLGHDTKEELFSTYTPTTALKNGDFFAEMLIEQIGNIIEKESNIRLEAKKAKIRKATAKYHS